MFNTRKNKKMMDNVIRGIAEIEVYYRSCPKKMIEILDYFSKMIKKEWSFISRNKVIYNNHLDPFSPNSFFPMNKENRMAYLIDLEELRSFQLTSTTIVQPWKFQRLYQNYFNLKKQSFDEEKTEGRGIYIQELDLVMIYHSNHSITTFLNFSCSDVIIKNVECYSMQKMIEEVDSDGVFWYNKKTKQKIEKVKELRVAILFYYAQKKDEILKKIKTNRLKSNSR